MSEALSSARRKRFKSHQIVEVLLLPEERTHPEARGNRFYCKMCLQQLPARMNGGKALSCKRQLAAYKTTGRGLQGRRRAWKNMIQSKPKHAQAFLQAIGWSRDQLDSFLGLSGPSEELRSNPRSIANPKKSPSLGGYRGKRVGEASNPGPVSNSKLSIFSINCGGAPAVWKLRKEGYLQAHVLCLQEVGMLPQEWQAFVRLAAQDGDRGYYMQVNRLLGVGSTPYPVGESAS